MKLRWQIYDLHLKHTFAIARSAKDISPSVFVEVEHDGLTGYGESAPSERYGENRDTVVGFLERIDLTSFTNPFQLDDILSVLRATGPGNSSAKAAIDIALHDWIGKRLGVPLWLLWGLNPRKTPTTSFTIGIDRLGVIGQKIIEAEEYPVLKVKVGIPGDDEIIRTVRQHTAKPLRVDANEGWKSKELALEKILWLEDQGTELVEQPMPASQLADIVWLKERVHVPLIADESVATLQDLPRLSGAFDGINIKLMKCGGLHEATRMIHTARALGLKIMLGCMIESSVAISAAAQLSPMADYADLDGNVLITNDPFRGVSNVCGQLILNDRPGVGAERVSDSDLKRDT